MAPRDLDGLFEKAKLLNTLEKHDEALELIDRVIAMEPNRPRGHDVRADNNFFHKELYQEALDDYDFVLVREPESWVVLMKRGGVLLSLERYADALDSLQRSLDIANNPNQCAVERCRLENLYTLALSRCCSLLPLCCCWRLSIWKDLQI